MHDLFTYSTAALRERFFINFCLFYIYFYFPEKIASKATAELYQTVNGTNCFLQVPDKLAQDINDIFEDLFRMYLIRFHWKKSVLLPYERK